MKIPKTFTPISVGQGHAIWHGSLPPHLSFSSERFEALWSLHPAEPPKIMMHGRQVSIPRWQQAYGCDYSFSGQTSSALDVPPILLPIHEWAKEHIDPGLNGLLLNWYDGALGHYIGPHRDSITNLVTGSPIVTISFGGSRVFRVRPWPNRASSPRIDCRLQDASVVLLPFETNRVFTHEITKSSAQNRRISVTLRAFASKA